MDSDQIYDLLVKKMGSFRISLGLLCAAIALANAQMPLFAGLSGLLPKGQSQEQSDSPGQNLILTLNNPLDPIFQRIASQSFPSRSARAQALTKAMKDATSAWQAPVLAALRPFNVETESYWVTNQIFVRNANPLVLAALRGLGILKSIAQEIFLPIMPIFNPSVGTPPNGTEWNVKKIGAEEVWKQSKGEGITVAVIDTGVRQSHVALKENYVGAQNNGWYDPILNLPTPTDNNGYVFLFSIFNIHVYIFNNNKIYLYMFTY